MNNRLLWGGVGLVGAVIVLALPSVVNSSGMHLLDIGVIYAIAVLGLYFVLGLTGQMNLAQGAFWGIGAYSSALLTTRLGWSPWLGLLAGGLVAGFFGLLLGAPTLRLKGHYLAMATIGFGIIVGLVLLNWDNVTRGADGVTNLPVFKLGDFAFSSVENYYYLLLLILVLLGAAAWRVRYSRVGRGLLAIRENELAAETMGINTTLYKVLAFSLGAAYGGVSGVLFAHMPDSRYISPDTFSFDQSVVFLAMLVLGGSGSIFGAIFGAIFLNFLPEWLKDVKQLKTGYLAVYGAGVMLMMVFLPVGVVGLFERLLRPWLPKPIHIPASPELVARVGRPASAGSTQLETSNQQPVTPNVVLELHDLRKYFGGIKAVDGINMRVTRGEIHALIGPNGSGKTTALNVISGIYKPTGGEITFNGQPIGGKSPHRLTAQGLARTFQNIRLFPELSALENVMIGQHVQSKTGLVGAIFPLPRSQAEERRIQQEAAAALEFVGLSEMQHQLAKNLAYGQQRRLEIARALAAKPTLLLLDEPAAGMNPAETEELVELLRKMRTQGLTLLLIEHDMNLVMSLSDAITVLNFGKEIADGVPQEIERNPAVIEAYLGAEVVNA